MSNIFRTIVVIRYLIDQTFWSTSAAGKHYISGYTFKTVRVEESLWAPSLAELTCPSFIKIDLSIFKKLVPWLREQYSVDKLKALVQRGISVDGTTYYVSGATQSSKSGVFYAYSQKDYWFENGFSKPKDVVRGGAVHAPATYGLSVMPSVKIGFAYSGVSKWPVADGMGWMFGSGPQIQFRSMLPGALLKGTFIRLQGKGKPGGKDMMLRAEDVKGDRMVATGVYKNVPLAILEEAKKGKMAVGDQTTQKVFEDEKCLNAFRSEFDGIVDRLTEVAAHPLELAKKATGVFRKQGGAVDTMEVIYQAAEFSQVIGNDDLMHSPGIQKLLNDWIISQNIRACLGEMEAVRLMVAFWETIADDVVIVHPDDVPAETHTGSRAKLLRMPDQHVWRTVSLRLATELETFIDGERYTVNTRGSMFMNPRTGAPSATDADGDQDGLILECERPLVKAWLDMPNEPLTSEKKRGKPGEAVDAITAMARILQVNVGSPYAAKAKVIALLQKTSAELRMVQDTIEGFDPIDCDSPLFVRALDLMDIIAWCKDAVVVCDREGQNATDTVKKLCLPDMDAIKAISSQATAYGLTFQDTAWKPLAHNNLNLNLFDDEREEMLGQGEADPDTIEGAIKAFDNAEALGKGHLKPWSKVKVSALERQAWAEKHGVELPENGETLVPSMLVSPSTPIGSVFCELGDRLPVPHVDERPYGEFVDRMPVLDGAGAEDAEKLYKEMLEAFEAIQGIGDAAEQKEKRSEAMAGFSRYCFGLMQIDTDDAEALYCHDQYLRQFVSRMWSLSFRSQESRQSLLWNSMPEMIFQMLRENADLWTVVDGTWSGVVYGQPLPAGQYKVRCESRVEDKNGRMRQQWHLAPIVTLAGGVDEAKAVTLPGGDKNAAWKREGEFTATLVPVAGTRSNSRITVAAVYHSEVKALVEAVKARPIAAYIEQPLVAVALSDVEPEFGPDLRMLDGVQEATVSDWY